MGSVEHKVPPSYVVLVSRVLVEVLVATGICIPLLRVFVFNGSYEPTRRGFFCDDASLKHPFVQESISTRQCFAIWSSLSFSVIVAVESLYHFTYPSETDRRLGVVPWVFVELYRVLGYFLLGSICTMLTTEHVKASVGSLRPHFLTVCNPALTRENCTDENGFPVYVQDYECSSDADPAKVSDARRSFFSGHSSNSFYCATYLIAYLNVRLARKPPHPFTRTNNAILATLFRFVKTLRPFIQFGIFMLAFHISISRLTEFKHHLTDIVVGVLFGGTFGILVITFTSELIKKPKVLLPGHLRNDAGDDTKIFRRSPVGQMPLSLRKAPYGESTVVA